MLAESHNPSADDLTPNPMTVDDLPSDFKAEAKLEDSNAVMAPSHTPDFLLTRIGARFVALPPAVPYLILIGFGFVVTLNTYKEGELATLTRMYDIGISVGGAILTVGSGVSLRRVTGGTRDGCGQLEKLGAGKACIDGQAHRNLKRAHVWLAIIAVLFVLLGLLSLVSTTKVGTRSKISGRLITEKYARAVGFSGLLLFNVALGLLPWWHTLKVASVLVARAVAETRQLIERCNPTSPEWMSEVLPRVLALCDETLPTMSNGWGEGVGLIFLGSWVGAAGFFAGFLEDGYPGLGFWTVFFVMTPLGIAYDAAAASSDCDMLSDTLATKRKRGDATDPAVEHAIRRVELILDRENTKQGLGFCVGYRVMDLKTFGNIVAAMAGVATTAVPIMISLRPRTTEASTGVCELTTTEIATIQSLMSRNDTCAYNATINEILGMIVR